MNTKDKLSLSDELNLVSEDGTLSLPMEKIPTRLIGEIEIYDGPTNQKMFTFHNDIIIPGATYALEKLFNIRSTFAMPTLSQDLVVKDTIARTLEKLKEEFIVGFVVGTGGTEPPDLVKSVKFKDKTVANIVPLRVVPTTADLTGTDATKYFLKKTVGSKYQYYGKKFDTNVTIRHIFTDGTEIPSNIDQTDTSLGLLVFAEAVLTISEKDLREYFTDQFGSIDNCQFNSLGLVAGFLDGSDYAGVRVVTKINMPNMPLRDSESFYKFVYKIYAI